MKKVDYKKMEKEIRKADPDAISEDGYACNDKTIPIMIKYEFIQKDEKRIKATKYNEQLLKKFKIYLKKKKYNPQHYQDIKFYAEFNEMSGCTLRFNDVDEEHFNYLLFNRCIRKTAGMDKSDFLSILKSFKIFSDFLREEGIHTADLFLKISNQEEKMIKRLEDYEYLGNLCDEGKISEEEYGERTYRLFGYGYME